ncbi:MAG: TetR/AcrR family transcriptional regulator [Bacteroidetes bacterium HGW-Bacteroidetes-1]|jgi:AcrR family transcriptional regulator|nr:MAG: TetR/AcrR family transcriptional regulator [Bacteroidetes bacterium HGW-Bacteroidetes-1]
MSTEENILLAARKVFLQKGFMSARMQEIADEAGINKALLHYYFRTKEKLFEQIFSDAFQLIKQSFTGSLLNSLTFSEFLRAFVHAYLHLLDQMPYLPQFILQELNRDSSRIITLFEQQKVPMSAIKKLIATEVENGEIIAIKPEHLIVNIISLIVFPFVARPIIKTFIFNQNIEDYSRFNEGRGEEIVQFILRAIRIPKNMI